MFNPKLASSKGFCIMPLPKKPKSPLFLQEEQSLRSAALIGCVDIRKIFKELLAG